MNCANHPDVVVSAYCQSCGKPLCAACIRSVGGVVYCEQCLGARLNSPPPGATPYTGAATGMHAHPVLAGLLGFIPGVGAMYNGQFVKALAHVLIFAVFVSLSDKSFVFGLLVAAWVFYQVFDAAQTAKARRDGLPLPNPFGLNDLGARLGVVSSPGPLGWTGFTAGTATGAAAPPPPNTPPPNTSPVDPANPAVGADPGWSSVPPSAAGAAYSTSAGTTPPPYSSVPGSYASGAPIYGSPLAGSRHRHPVGAVVLIGIGVLLLLHTLGVFEDEWFGRAWPLLLIGIGGWLLYRRTRETTQGGL